jgi:hypothetical protein
VNKAAKWVKRRHADFRNYLRSLWLELASKCDIHVDLVTSHWKLPAKGKLSAMHQNAGETETRRRDGNDIQTETDWTQRLEGA